MPYWGLKFKLVLALLWLLSFITSPLSGQETWPRALEIFSPFDADGYVIPAEISSKEESPDAFEEESAALEEADESLSPLMIWSLNDKGFMHRGRRKAIPLDGNAMPLPQKTRIYTGGTGVLAFGAAERFYALLQAPSSLHAAQGEKGWRWTLLENQSNLRLSCHGEAPRIRWKDYSDEAWRELSLLPSTDSDLIVVRDHDSLEIYQMQGRSRFYAPSQRLRPARQDGLLRELQDLQLSPRRDGRTRIELKAEQVLRLDKKGDTFTVLISSADPEIWGPRILASSPQIKSAVASAEKPASAGIRALRLRVLEERSRDIGLDAANVRKLTAQARYEEALHMLRRLSTEALAEFSDESVGLEAFLLYRLQQNDAGLKLSKILAPQHALQKRLANEQRLALLRAKNIADQDLAPASLALSAPLLEAEERYQLGLSWQRLDATRTALDYWELGIVSEEPELMQRSRTEWVDQLLEKKSWAYALRLAYGRSSNVLQNAAVTDPERAAVDSPRTLAEGSLERTFERNAQLSIKLQLDLRLDYHSNEEVQAIPSAGASVSFPIELRQIFGPETRLLLKPEVGRKQRGAAALDFLAYLLEATLPLGEGYFTQSFRQMQSLDPNPNAVAVLDVETGERGFTSDQGVKGNQLLSVWQEGARSLWPTRFSFGYRQLNYRSPLRNDWDRQIVSLGAGLSHAWNLAFSSSISADFEMHRFEASGSKPAAQSGGEIGLRSSYKSHLRWEHGVSWAFSQRPSALFGVTQSSTVWMFDSRYNW